MNLIELLSDIGTFTSKLRGEYIFRQGDKDRSLYLVKSGLVKAYYLNLEGKEHVKSFVLANDFIGSMTSCHSLEECSFSLICLEPTEFFEVDFQQLREMALSNIQLSNHLNDALLELAMKKERREFEFLCLTAEERYQLLRERHPVLLELVTQNDIARYLGITPVALSRIKTRILNSC